MLFEINVHMYFEYESKNRNSHVPISYYADDYSRKLFKYDVKHNFPARSDISVEVAIQYQFNFH